MISLFCLYQQKERKRLLTAKLSADVCWVFHYLFLGAYGGMIPNFVGIFRELVFVRRDKDKWANSVFFPIAFIILNWGLGALTFRSPINILPIVASTFVTVALWCNKPVITKLISLPVSLTFLVYDCFVSSWIGVFNESLSVLSIVIYFVKYKLGGRKMKSIFTKDVATDKPHVIIEGKPIENPSAVLTTDVSAEVKAKGDAFAREITERFVSDFEKAGTDKMAHVSTFTVIDGIVYTTYYANTGAHVETPDQQTARLVYCPVATPADKTFIDIMSAGDTLEGMTVTKVYDTILMQKDGGTLYVMWTAEAGGNYYRFYRTFDVANKTLSEVKVNRFKVGEITNDFSTSGIQNALAANGLGYKKMYSDIGIMQKLTSRVENGETYYYTGAYSGDFTCVIKSRDLITWEYVSAPDFINFSKWENATFVLGDKCYYFVRQQDECRGGFLTVLDLNSGKWETPVLIDDCQSRSDFILYHDKLYLFHAPVDREHIGIVEVDTDDISKSRIILQAKMHSSCFYPFIQYFSGDELAMSYTVNREHIRLAEFTLGKYTD